MQEPLLLLDTDIVSRMGRQRPPPGLRSWLLMVGVDRLGISFPVITEMLRGAYLVRDENPEKSAAIRRWVADVLATDFQFPEMCAKVADIYARMTSLPCLKSMWTVQRHEKNNRLGHDLMIASMAIVHNAPIITMNTRDFVRVNEWFPLPGVYQPIESRWYVKPDYFVSLPEFIPDDLSMAGNRLPRICNEDHQVRASM